MPKSSYKPEDTWNLSNLLNEAHPSAKYVDGRVRGFLGAELTETLKSYTGISILGFTKVKGVFSEGDRKAIVAYLTDPENAEAVRVKRDELRADAQAAFDTGKYGDNARGPVAESPRIKTIMTYIQTLLGDGFPAELADAPENRGNRTLTADDFMVNPAYAKHRRAVNEKLAALTAGKAIALTALAA